MTRGIVIFGLACAVVVAIGGNLGDPKPESALPAETREGGFTTSDTCRACHPGPYRSWHDSFHRTMTQAASSESIVGDFDDVVLESRGQITRLERRADRYWAELPDPAWFMDPDPDKIAVPPRIEVPVVMTTGSHHMQYYWIRRPTSGPLHVRPDHGALMSLPWVWLIDDARWIPVQDSFLTPPNPSPENPLTWNTSCFACHSVATQPQYSAERDEFESRSVELGIACEACHGPAGEHVRVNRSPLRRYAKYIGLESEGDATIVNPARLSAGKSRDVCGQCHSFGEPIDFDAHKLKGVAFRPGADLAETQRLYRFARKEANSEQPAGQHDNQGGENPGGNFWADGTIRVAGREYNGLMETGCATRGELTCLTCHAMHDYREPNDQLASGIDSDAACLGCHPTIASAITQHTHHLIDSAGSSCMNCHMPHTSYGLFVAMRSHRIDSPSAATQAETGRPNACNLCHLDQTLAWTNERLHAWYGQAKTELSRDDHSVASSVLWALKGNAVQRGLVAWHMGWEPAQTISGRKWLAAYLAILLRDPYVAVRRVAHRSISRLPGFERFEYDFIAQPDTLAASQLEAIGRWRTAMAGRPDRVGPHLLQNARGEMNQATLSRILAARDHTPIRISE